jgi:Protein of unknown function (DUF664)
MPSAGVHTEIEEIAGYLEGQLAGIRNAAFGLTDDQARDTPCRSALSIGGLVRHATYVMQGRERRLANPGQGPTPEGYVLFTGSFEMPEGQTLEEALAEFGAAAKDYLAGIRGTDPDAPDVEPPAPWAGIVDPIPTRTRFHLLHQIEELARHAGHADIIREQLDGAQSGELAMAVAGAPANDFAKPWQPPDR